MSKYKYIIFNCTAFCKGICGADDTDIFCYDETDCVMKQVIELCKETCRKRCTNYCLGKQKYCGYGQILQKLDMQEVE